MLNDSSVQAAATEFTETAVPPAPSAGQRSWVPKALILLFLLFMTGLATAAAGGGSFFHAQSAPGKTDTQAKCAQTNVAAGVLNDVAQVGKIGPVSFWRCFPLHGDSHSRLCLTATKPLSARL